MNGWMWLVPLCQSNAVLSKVLGYLPPLYPIMPWGPAIDGTKVGLVDLPIHLLERGQFNKV